MCTIWAWLNSFAICDDAYDTDSDVDLGELCGDECDEDTNDTNNANQRCECGCGCRAPPTYTHAECGDTRLRPGRQSGADEPAKYGLVCPAQVN